MELVTIKKGEYILNQLLTASLKTDLKLVKGGKYLLNGDNGSGKSLFIKSVLIPEIDKVAKNKFLYFHSEQDLALQFYIIRGYYRGIRNEEIIIDTFDDALTILKEKYLQIDKYKNEMITYILDEIDQYTDMAKFIDGLMGTNSTIILTTHNQILFNNSKDFYRINFQKKNQNNTDINFNS